MQINCLIYKLRGFMQVFQPPPPAPKKSRKLLIALAIILIVIIAVPTVAFLFSNNPPVVTPTPTPNNTGTPVPTEPPTTSTANHYTIQTGTKTPVTTQSVTASGGNIQVTDSSSPMNGLKIDVPPAATTEPVQFVISYSDISNIDGLPGNCVVAGKMISIEATGTSVFNQYQMFNKPIAVTLPYEASDDHNSVVRYYWYDPETRIIDSCGFLSEDGTAHTITFMTASFSDFLAVRTFLNWTGNTLGLDASVDTHFRPARDGWFIPNMGSYLAYSNSSTLNGFCLGMVSYAKWYYSNIASGFHSKYLEGDRTEWRDDATAMQLAARAHIATEGIWASLNSAERTGASDIWATADSRQVGLSLIAGMIVTGEPQLIGLKTELTNGSWINGHAIMTYSYGNGNFEIYDPNYPGSQSGDPMREIPFNYTDGFSQMYASAQNAADKNSGNTYNVFYHAGAKLASTPSDYMGLYRSAEQGFKGDNLFPVITLTDSTTTPQGTTPVDTDSDGVRDTTEAKTTISGTITNQHGENNLTEIQIFVDNNQYTVPLTYSDSNTALFSKEVPLMQGLNDVIVLATDTSTFNNYAGFLRAPIKSSASPTAFTVTLTWDQDTSDVDLHIQEPGTDGRHIYYSNQGGGSNYPYLDMDNTHGFGPEHYYATENMVIPGLTNLYGTYQIRVNYYADHSDADTPQTITWHLHVKYLAFKNTATGQEFWVEDSRSGSLSTPNSDSTNVFQNGGAGWSSIWEINYQSPNLQDFNVPPPPQNVFKWSP